MGGSLANWLVSNIWRNKVWRINISANRLLIVSTNLDGFSLANRVRFAELSRYGIREDCCIREYRSDFSPLYWHSMPAHYALNYAGIFNRDAYYALNYVGIFNRDLPGNFRTKVSCTEPTSNNRRRLIVIKQLKIFILKLQSILKQLHC